MIIYVNYCDYSLSQTAGGNNMQLYIDLLCIHLIVFYFVFSAAFIWVGLNLTNMSSFWFYVCSLVYVNLNLFNTY